MSTFVPTIPLLVQDVSISKTTVETSPGVFALNTVGGGGGGTSAWTPADVNEIISNTVYDDGALNKFTVAESARESADYLQNIKVKTDLIGADVDAINVSMGSNSDADTEHTVIGLLKSIIDILS